MHAFENFEDVSAQGHRQWLGVEAKTKGKDLPAETKAKAEDFTNVLEDPRDRRHVLEDHITGCCGQYLVETYLRFTKHFPETW